MDEKLKVCLMNDSFPPTLDGVANVVVNYAGIIQRELGEAVVVTPKYPDVVDNYSFPVLRYRSFDTMKLVGYRTGYPFSVSALHELKSMNLDIIHTHCPVASNFFARLLREAIDVPIVFTYHTKYNYDISNIVSSEQLQKAATKVMISNIEACDETWVVSDAAGENLRSLGYEGDFIVMRNGVDFPKGRVPEEKSASLKKEHGIPDGVPVLLFVGRIKWYKGLKLIIDALAILKAAGYNFKMLFVGEGVDREEVEAYALKRGVTENCIFTGAVLDRDKLRAYYCCGDVFLFPSTFDTNGIVVREAAACAVPCVLIKSSGASEGIEHDFTGILIDENAEALAAALKHGFDTEGYFRGIGINAMNNIYYSWEDSVKKAFTRYGEVVEKYQKGSYMPIKRDEFFASMSVICDKIEQARYSIKPRTEKKAVFRRKEV